MPELVRATAGVMRRAGFEPGAGMDDDETTGFTTMPTAGELRAAGFGISPNYDTLDAATTGFEVICHAIDDTTIAEVAIAQVRGDAMPETTN